MSLFMNFKIVNGNRNELRHTYVTVMVKGSEYSKIVVLWWMADLEKCSLVAQHTVATTYQQLTAYSGII